jgi:hypothetical protein
VTENAATIQKRILDRTGDIDPTTGDAIVGGGGYLSSIISKIWNTYADKAYISPRLQELYTERDCYDAMLGILQEKYTFRDADTEINEGDLPKNVAARRDKVQERIDALVAMAAANRPGAVGQITTTAPVSAPYGGLIDANNRRYSGDPYFPRRWGYP